MKLILLIGLFSIGLFCLFKLMYYGMWLTKFPTPYSNIIYSMGWLISMTIAVIVSNLL